MTVTLDLAAASTDTHTRRALQELSSALVKRKRIVVVTGAGISCSCGIPDFRSSDGLYNMVKERYPDVVLKGRDLFDASLFRDTTSTSVFYSFIAELKRKIDVATPSSTHHFLKTLDSKNKLLRSYTQNIDGLEERVGLVGSSGEAAKITGTVKGANKLRVKDVRNVQLHGDIHRVRCVVCCAEYPCGDEHLSAFLNGTAPSCPECLSRSEARVARSARPTRIGSLRPAIVLYDEPHPLGDEIGTIQMADINKKPDMLIIMGTSMKVHGLKQLVRDFAKSVRASTPTTLPASPAKPPFKVIFVNKTAPGSEWADIIDYHVAGDTDTWVAKVMEDWRRIKPSDFEIQTKLAATDQVLSATGAFKINKPLAEAAKAKKKPNKNKKMGENIAPEPSSSFCVDIPSRSNVPPPSPSKRQQKSSHYDDVHSSPSKRHSKSSLKLKQELMPAGERGMLFNDATNTNDVEDETFYMETSICERSMLDMTGEVQADINTNAPAAKGKSKASATELAAASKLKVLAKPLPRRRTRTAVAILT